MPENCQEAILISSVTHAPTAFLVSTLPAEFPVPPILNRLMSTYLEFEIPNCHSPARALRDEPHEATSQVNGLSTAPGVSVFASTRPVPDIPSSRTWSQPIPSFAILQRAWGVVAVKVGSSQ